MSLLSGSHSQFFFPGKEKKKEKSPEPKKAKTKKAIAIPAAAPVEPAALAPEAEARPGRRGLEREVVHNDYYQLLLEEAKR